MKPVFHCFNGNVEQGKKIEDIGGHIGLGGVITYKSAGMDKVLPELSENIMLLETDAPYLSPVPMRGKRNEPSFILHTADKLSEYLGKDKVEICDITTRNALKLFHK